MNMMLHRGGKVATYDEIAQLPTPEATPTWTPVAHVEIVNLLRQSVNDLGLTIDTEAYALARNGHQFFGVVRMQTGHAEHGLVIGARNSTDKSLSAAFAGGAGVFVCDNLMFAGEVVVMRKHTRNVRAGLVNLLSGMLGQVVPQYQDIAHDIDWMKNYALDDDAAYALLGQAYGRNILGTRQLAHASREWLKPSHQDFAGANRWSLYNACTEALKTATPDRAMERYTQLHALMTNAA